MRHKILEAVDAKSIRHDLPNFRIGDNVKVHVRIREGNKERIQIFEGLVIAIKNEGVSKSFTVRKIAHSVGVERTFPVNSPIISHIDIVSSNKVRRSKLYYMRGLTGKSTRLETIKRKKVKPVTPKQAKISTK